MFCHSLYRRIVYSFIELCLFSAFLVACSSGSTGSGHNNTPQASSSSPTVSPTPITQPVPPTQTDCPPAQTGRALVTAPLAQGTDPQVVYVPNDSPEASHVIVRYDTVTHASTDIVTLPAGQTVKDIFLVRDDQWVFFFTGSLSQQLYYPGGTLQAVRIDGQGLQTLYCDLPAVAPLFSPDHHYLAFADYHQYPGAPDTIHVFDTTSGQVFDKVKNPLQDGTSSYDDPFPFQWVSNTQLYLRDDPQRTGKSNIFLLDVTGGDNQTVSSLKSVTQQSNISMAMDSSSLYIGQQQCQNQAKIVCIPSTLVKSTISRLALQGGSAQQIYENAQLAIDTVEMAGSQSLLVSGTNSSSNTYEIWTMNTDGSNAKRIASAALVPHTGIPRVGSISDDHTQFLVSNWRRDAGSTPQAFVGSVGDGTLTAIQADGYQSGNVVGWTVL